MATTVASKMGKQERLLAAFQSGKALTPAQIKSSYKLANPRAAVNNLRVQGHSIITESRVNSKGKTMTVYSAGSSRRVTKARV